MAYNLVALNHVAAQARIVGKLLGYTNAHNDTRTWSAVPAVAAAARSGAAHCARARGPPGRGPPGSREGGGG